MKVHLKTLLLIGGTAAVIGVLVLVSGAVPIKASSGHWAITAWFLDFAKSRSVGTHSSTIEVPELNEESLVTQGAGHYEIGCVQCHGRPGLEMPAIAMAMTPSPPELAGKVKIREPEELFYMVQHGIKFTGMPAWPVLEREDEIWAVVAFLLKYPELTARQYETLVWGENRDSADQRKSNGEQSTRVPHEVIETCAICHGIDGQGRGLSVFPAINGQNKEYLRSTLEAYRSKQRQSGTMQIVARQLDDAQIAALAEYYANLSSLDHENRTADDPAAVKRGEQLAVEGNTTQKIPSCADCHPVDGSSVDPHYPLLNGQSAEYLELQLKLFQDDIRGGTADYNLMHPVVQNMTAEQMRDVSLFYASLQRATNE